MFWLHLNTFRNKSFESDFALSCWVFNKIVNKLHNNAWNPLLSCWFIPISRFEKSGRMKAGERKVHLISQKWKYTCWRSFTLDHFDLLDVLVFVANIDEPVWHPHFLAKNCLLDYIGHLGQLGGVYIWADEHEACPVLISASALAIKALWSGPSFRCLLSLFHASFINPYSFPIPCSPHLPKDVEHYLKSWPR